MDLSCDDCGEFDEDGWTEDDAGLHCESCYEDYIEKSILEAGIPPHSYRVNANAAYDWGNYKNEDYLETIFDSET